MKLLNFRVFFVIKTSHREARYVFNQIYMKFWGKRTFEIVSFLNKFFSNIVFVMHSHSIDEGESLSCTNIPCLKKLSIYHAQTFHWRSWVFIMHKHSIFEEAEYLSCTTIPLKKLEWHVCLNVQRMPHCQATWRTGIATVAPGSLSLSSRQGSEKCKPWR